MDLDSILEPDHPVRDVWEYVGRLDLTVLYERIQSIRGSAGRPAIDPRLLFALWIWATLRGVGSARQLERLCSESAPYRWLCGGVSVNYHTLADFRVSHADVLESLLIESIVAMRAAGIAKMERVTIDGTKVRASAGAGSFRTRPTLERYESEARAQVEALRDELDADAGGSTRREKAARERAARERKKRLEQAVKTADELKKKSSKKKRKVRASTTDPEARVMKMADGGFRPAYNIQLVADLESSAIVGLEVTNIGTDMGQLAPEISKLAETLDFTPSVVIADGGYAKKEDIEQLSQQRIRCIVPPQKPKTSTRGIGQAHKNDSEAIKQWRADMETDPAKQLYLKRPPCELLNARLKACGLERLVVRGVGKVKAVMLWFVLAHNFRFVTGVSPA
jgi:transposase